MTYKFKIEWKAFVWHGYKKVKNRAVIVLCFNYKLTTLITLPDKLIALLDYLNQFERYLYKVVGHDHLSIVIENSITRYSFISRLGNEIHFWSKFNLSSRKIQGLLVQNTQKVWLLKFKWAGNSKLKQFTKLIMNM